MILLKNGTLYGKRTDVLIHDGRVEQIAPDIRAESAQVMDCEGMLVLPGLIDLHCHLRDPGQEYKEDIISGTRAAARGGFTAVCCMANTIPVNDNAAMTKFILDRAATMAATKVYPIGAVTKGIKGEELAEYGDMRAAGAVALSDDGKPVPPGMMRMAMRYALAFDMPIASHSEDLSLTGDGAMNEGGWSTMLGIKGIPASAEETAVARDCALALETGARLHICHVSAKGSIEVIRHYKSRGAKVTCETAPHYIAGTDALCEGYDPHARVSPPLRSEQDRCAVIEALKEGVIDCIATDHAPHHMDEKNVEFSQALSGISGFETALSLCHTYLVEAGHMDAMKLSELMSRNPAKIFGLPGGTVEVGKDADITVFDPDAQWTIDRGEFISMGKNTPFHGFSVKGKVMATIVDGRMRYVSE